jgi:hypothetical protein
MGKEIVSIIKDCESFIQSKNYESFDIFDALTCSWINFLTQKSVFLRRVAIQINARSPFNLHWLGMRKMQHTKTISDMLWLYSLQTSSRNESQIKLLLDNLIARAVTGKLVWGLNFNYATRFTNACPETPNLYNTCTVGLAITECFEKYDLDLNMLETMYKDLCNTFEFINEGNKGFFIYYPGQKHPTYNVNALALYLFSRINFVSKKEIVPQDKIKRMVNLIVSEQLEDGSWFYSRSSKGEWVDGFHSGFIIESLIYTFNSGMNVSEELHVSINKAIEFYLSKMFTSEGYPKYFDYSDKYPVECQNIAQAIQTLSLIKEYTEFNVDDLLDSLVKNTINDLYSGKGYFYYKKERYYLYKQNYFRWSTAPILVSLQHYLKTN